MIDSPSTNGDADPAPRAPDVGPPHRAAPSHEADSSPDAPGGVRDFLIEVAALVEFSKHLLAVRLDELRLQCRRLARSVFVVVALALAAVVFVGAAMLISAAYLVDGLAGGVAAAAGGRAWLGRLVAGGVVVSGLLGALALHARRSARRTRAARLRRAQARRARQRALLGRDAQEVARDAG